tara:strand:+ start:4821 stop:17516 length:12696 start_codon:yes stop_codon:yes gene_type:complete
MSNNSLIPPLLPASGQQGPQPPRSDFYSNTTPPTPPGFRRLLYQFGTAMDPAELELARPPMTPLGPAKSPEQREQDFVTAFRLASQQDARLRSEIRKIGHKLEDYGVSEAAIRDNLPTYRRIFQSLQVDRERLRKTAPSTYDALTNPRFANVAWDITPELTTVEQLFNDAKKGWLLNKLGKEAAGMALGDLSPEQWEQIAKLQNELRELEGADIAFLSPALTLSGQFVEGAVSALPYGAAGAGAGAAAGAFALGAGAIPGAAVGFKAGMTTGYLANSFMVNSGLSAIDMHDRGYDSRAIRSSMIAVGLGNMALDYIGAKAVAGLASKTPIGEWVRKTTSRNPLDKVRITDTAKDIGKAVGSAVLTETATETGQTINEMVFEEIARQGGVSTSGMENARMIAEALGAGLGLRDAGTVVGLDGQTYQSRISEGQFGSEVWETIKEVSQGMTVIGGVGGVYRAAAMRSLEKKEVTRTQDILTKIQEAPAELADRDPDSFRQWMQEVARDSGAENVKIPLYKLREKLRAAGIGEDEARDIMPEMEQAEELEQVLGDTVDVVVGIDRIKTEVVPRKGLFDAIKPAFRMGDDRMSFEEFQEREEAVERARQETRRAAGATEAAEGFGDPVEAEEAAVEQALEEHNREADQVGKVRRALVGMYRDAKVTGSEASAAIEMQMGMMRAAYKNFNVQEGLPFDQWFDNLGLEIVRNLDGRVQPAADARAQNLRSGRRPQELLGFVNAQGGFTLDQWRKMGVDIEARSGQLRQRRLVRREGGGNIEAAAREAQAAGFLDGYNVETEGLETAFLNAVNDALDGSMVTAEGFTGERMERMEREAGERSRPQRPEDEDPDAMDDPDTILFSEDFDQPADADYDPSTYRPEVVSWAAQTFGDRVAPNGRPVADNFVAWFGDSKLVNDQGEPRVLYHGTAAKFGAFTPSYDGTYGPGVYLAMEAKDANEYAELSRMRQRMMLPADDAEAMRLSDQLDGERVYPVYANLQNPYVVPNELGFDPDVSMPTPDELRAQGYDGIIDPDGEVVIFDSAQIKSTQNRGDFSSSARILEQGDFDQPGDADYDEGSYRPEVVAWAKQRFGDRVAPNGRPIYQNFVAWFGDSELVDEQGRPQTWFKSMVGDMPRMSRMDRRGPQMTFAAPAREAAEAFARPTDPDTGFLGTDVQEVYLSADNVFDYRNPEHAKRLHQAVAEDPAKLARWADDYNYEFNDTPEDALLEFSAGLEGGYYTTLELPTATEAIEAMGFDAFYVSEGEAETDQFGVNIALTRPQQLKSVNNVGDFSSSPVILEQGDFGQASDAAYDEGSYRPEVVAWAKEKFGDRVAPNGRPAYQNFVAWFGDSGLVDAQGRPQTWFKSMVGDMPNMSMPPDSRAPELTFAAPTERAAEFFATPETVLDVVQDDGSTQPETFPPSSARQVYISARNVFDYRKPEHAKQLQQAILDDPQKLEQAATDFAREYDSDTETGVEEVRVGLEVGVGYYQTMELATVTQAIIDLGYDAFYVAENDSGAPNIALTRPQQLKSVDNVGDFSSSPVILEQTELTTLVPHNEQKAADMDPQDVKVPGLEQALQPGGEKALAKNVAAFDEKVVEGKVDKTTGEKKPDKRAYDSIAAEGDSAEERAESILNQMVENLLHIFDSIPEDVRERSRLWYVGANRIAREMADRYGISLSQLAGMLAVTSPQADWRMNVSYVERIADALTQRQDQEWTPEMEEWASGWINSATQKQARATEAKTRKARLQKAKKDAAKSERAFAAAQAKQEAQTEKRQAAVDAAEAKLAESRADVREAKKQLRAAIKAGDGKPVTAARKAVASAEKKEAKANEQAKKARADLRALASEVGKAKTKLRKDRDAVTEKQDRVNEPDPNLTAYEAVRGKKLRELDDAFLQAWWIRSFDEAHNQRGFREVTPEGGMLEFATTGSGALESIGWKSFNAIAKAAELFQDDSVEALNRNLGGEHKVRNFYNNIFNPEDGRFVTSDTHQVAANLFLPLGADATEVTHNFGGTGSSSVGGIGLNGTYWLYHEAVARAAAQRQHPDGAPVLPREMQSISWEAIRSLFSDSFKRDEKKVNQVRDLWVEYQNGARSIEETWAAIEELAGGYSQPFWVGKRPADAMAFADGHSSYETDLLVGRQGDRTVRPGDGRDAGPDAASGTRTVLYSEEVAPKFTSALEDTVLGAPLKEATPQGWAEYLEGRTRKGVLKSEELQAMTASGLAASSVAEVFELALEPGDHKLTREQAAEIVSQHALRVQVRPRGDQPIPGDLRDQISTELQQLVADGVIEDDNVEIPEDHASSRIADLPTVAEAINELEYKGIDIGALDKLKALDAQYGDETLTLTDEKGGKMPGYRELLVQLDLQRPEYQQFKHTHFASHDNVAVFSRLSSYNTDEQQLITMVHELQSDWAQEARRQGGFLPTSMTEQDYADSEGAMTYFTAPFVTKTQSWTMLGLKRSLMDAVAQGHQQLQVVDGATINHRRSGHAAVGELRVFRKQDADANTVQVEVVAESGGVMLLLQVDRKTGRIVDAEQGTGATGKRYAGKISLSYYRGNKNKKTGLYDKGKTLAQIYGPDVRQEVLQPAPASAARKQAAQASKGVSTEVVRRSQALLAAKVMQAIDQTKAHDVPSTALPAIMRAAEIHDAIRDMNPKRGMRALVDQAMELESLSLVWRMPISGYSPGSGYSSYGMRKHLTKAVAESMLEAAIQVGNEANAKDQSLAASLQADPETVRTAASRAEAYARGAAQRAYITGAGELAVDAAVNGFQLMMDDTQGDVSSIDMSLGRGREAYVGGEGMLTYYDEVVPAVMKKLAREYGGEFVPAGPGTGAAFQDPDADYDSRTGITYTDMQRGPVATTPRSANFASIIVTPEMRQRVQQGVALFSEEPVSEGGRSERVQRARFIREQVGGRMRRVIELLRDANPTSIYHELAHAFFDYQLSELEQQLTDPDGASSDLLQETMLAFFESMEVGPENGSIQERLDAWNALTSEEQEPLHEAIARNFEVYLGEGEAPTRRQKRLFQRVRAFMVQVYEDVALRVNDIYRKLYNRDLFKVQGDVKQAFDRMVAAQEDIDKELERADVREESLSPELYADDRDEPERPAPSVVDDEDMRAEARDDAIDELTRELLADAQLLESLKGKATSEAESDARRARRQIKARAEQELQSRRVHRLRNFLRSGKLIAENGTVLETRDDNTRLNTEQVRRLVPGIKLNDLGGALTSPQGMDVQTVTDLFGYESSSQMIAELRDSMTYREEVQAVVDREMLEKYGNLATPEAVQRSIKKAVYNEARQRALLREIEQITGVALPVDVTLQAARDVAKQRVSQLTLREMRPYQFQNDAMRSRREAFRQLRLGNRPRASQAFRAELLYNAMVREAAVQRKEAESRIRRMEQNFAFGRDAEKAKTRDMRFIAFGRVMLSAIGLGGSADRSMDQVAQIEQYDPEFYQANQGLITAITKMATNNVLDLRGSTLQEALDMIESVWDRSYTSRQITVAGRRMDRDQLAASLATRLMDLKKVDPDLFAGQLDAQTAQAWSRSQKWAQMKRFEQAMMVLDGGEEGGLFARSFYEPLREALDRSDVELARHYERLQGLMQAVNQLEQDAPQEIVAPELGGYTFGLSQRGDNGAIHEIVTMVANLGTISNRDRLMSGFAWSQKDEGGHYGIQPVVKFINRLLQEGVITRDVIDLAQGMMDTFELIKPDFQKALFEVEGRYVKEIDAEPFQILVDGEVVSMAGGYVPMRYDQDQSQTDRRAADEARARAQTLNLSSSATKERQQNPEEKINLRLDTLMGTFQEHVRYAYVVPVVKQVRDLLRASNVQDMFQRDRRVSLGQVLKQMDPGIYGGGQNSVLDLALYRASSGSLHPNTAMPGPYSRAINSLRRRMGSIIFTFHVRNAVENFGALFGGLSTQFGVPLKYVAPAWRARYADLAYIRKVSPMMDGRLQKGAQQIVAEDFTPAQLREKLSNRIGYLAPRLTQQLLEATMWKAAHDQWMVEMRPDGMSDTQAIEEARIYADRKVRINLGSGDVLDAPGYEGAYGELGRMLTQFTGWFAYKNSMAQVAWARATTEGGLGGYGRFTWNALCLFYLEFMFGAALAALLKGDDGSDDEDKWEAFAIESMIKVPMRMALAGAIPIAGDMIGGGAEQLLFGSGRGIQAPRTGAFDWMARNASKTLKLLEGEFKGDELRAAVELAAGMLGRDALMLPAFAGRQIGYAGRLMSGEETPEGVTDAVRGFIQGK